MSRRFGGMPLPSRRRFSHNAIMGRRDPKRFAPGSRVPHTPNLVQIIAIDIKPLPIGPLRQRSTMPRPAVADACCALDRPLTRFGRSVRFPRWPTRGFAPKRIENRLLMVRSHRALSQIQHCPIVWRRDIDGHVADIRGAIRRCSISVRHNPHAIACRGPPIGCELRESVLSRSKLVGSRAPIGNAQNQRKC